jgi:CubicO group peptidase (beta-lactamase class C family)
MTRRLFVLASALLALWAPAAAAQARQPDTPAAHQLLRWLETFNANDRAIRSKFLAENVPSRAQMVDQDLAFREQTGGFDFVKFEEATATKAIAIVKEHDADATGVKLTVEVDAAEPHHITNVGLQPGIPLDVKIPHLADAELAQAVKAEAEKRAAAGRFSGTVMVARDGKPIMSGAYGLADRAKNLPNTIDTRFRNGSMNKMFTAVATLTLAQAGKLKLDDPIGKYLTDYPNKTVASKVTVHHLLTHTGGTGDIFGPEFMTHRLELKTHQDYLNLYGKRDLLFEPGSKWSYSNYGFVLLGAIIERVSGQSYYDYVREHVYRPAGMRDTGSDPEDSVVANRSVGYMRGGPGAAAGLQPNTETLPYRGMAAGGGYTTVGDLVRFATALMHHQLLDAHYTDLLLTGKVDAFAGKYAYGMVDRTINGLRAVGHGGGAPGMNGDLLFFPQTGYAVAVLANLDPPAAQRISEFAAYRVSDTPRRDVP